MKIDTIKIGNMTVVKQTYQPGWVWSKNIKQIAGTKTCQGHHLGIWISGRMRVKTDDGNEVEFGPDDVADIPPGHDGWVVGDKPAIFYTISYG